MQSTADQNKVTTPKPISIPVTVEKSVPITIFPERKLEPVVAYSPLPFDSSSHISTVTENRVSQSVTKFTLEHSTPPIPSPKPYEPIKSKEEISIPIQIIKEAPKKEEKQTVVETKHEIMTDTLPEQTGIETSSISKQSSLDFFVSKMKSTEETPKPKLVETQKISPDIYTKFQETSTTKSEPIITHQIRQEVHKSFEPIVTHETKHETHTSFDKGFKSFSSSTKEEYQQFSTSQAQLFEEFNLTPEPPPEMCFMSKIESVQKKEDVTDKIKKLEDSRRDLSAMEVPIGAIKIFPTASPKPVEHVEERKEIVEDLCVKKHVERKDIPDYNQSCSSVPDTKYWSPVIFKPQPVPPKLEIEIPIIMSPTPVDSKPMSSRPFSPRPFSPRPVSPRPSAEAVQMEKLWTPQISASPLIPNIPEPVRAPSPKPSPQGLAMEKMWTQKTVESSYTTYNKPLQSPGIAPEPSIEGKTMEKMWAHKHAESNLKTVWPPPQTEEMPSMQKPIHVIFEKQKPAVETRSESYINESTSSVQKPIHVVVEKQKPAVDIRSESHVKELTSSVQKPIHVLAERQKPLFEARSESYLRESSSVQKPIHIEVEKPKPLMETRSESYMKESSSFSKTHHEFRSVQPPMPIISPPVLIPVTVVTQPVTHYIATVSNVANFATPQITSSSSSSYTHRTESTEVIQTHNENVIEEHQSKASELIKAWPPAPLPRDEPPLKAPQMVKEIFPKIESLSIRPVSVQDITDEVYLEPGPPPEIGFAQAPRKRRQSYVESIEQDLEKNLAREPSRVLPGSVRTIPPPREKALPPPLPPKKEVTPGPPLPAKPVKLEPPKKVEADLKPFERFPDLEPFPFKAGQDKPKSPKPPPPPTPSKFIKGRFCDSDYESDVEAMKISAKWKSCTSDNDEPSFRKVQPPKLGQIKRSRSTEPEPLPPSKFDHPPQFQGPPRPELDLEQTKRELKKEVTIKQVVTKQLQTKREIKTNKYQFQPISQPKQQFQSIVQPKPQFQPIVPLQPQPKVPSPPELKPGSPPIFVQVEPPKPKPVSPKPKPDSPKLKTKLYKESGYMADTDEPLTLARKSAKLEHHKTEQRTETRQHISQTFESSSSQQKVMVETRSTSVPQAPPRVTHKFEHKKHITSSAASKKVRE